MKIIIIFRDSLSTLVPSSGPEYKHFSGLLFSIPGWVLRTWNERLLGKNTKSGREDDAAAWSKPLASRIK